MTPFFWSHGHIGWYFFGIIVFSVLCLLTVDIVWRVMVTSLRTLVSASFVVWVLGVGALIACWHT